MRRGGREEGGGGEAGRRRGSGVEEGGKGDEGRRVKEERWVEEVIITKVGRCGIKCVIWEMLEAWDTCDDHRIQCIMIMGYM